MPLEIRQQPLGDKSILIELKGDADIDSSGVLRKIFRDRMDNGKFNFIVDLSGVTGIDLSVLDLLLSAHKETRQKNGDIVLIANNHYIQQILSLTGLDGLFRIFSNWRNAIRNLTDSTIPCLNCSLFCGVPNCPTLKSLAYPSEPCMAENRNSWLASSFQGQSGILARERRKGLIPFPDTLLKRFRISRARA